MKKNVASQSIGCQMVSATDGSAFTGSVTVYVTGDNGTQAVGSVGAGACTHEGNGYHSYAPAQAETNYDHVAFTFIGTGAVPATVQTFTTFPQTGDNYARLGAPAGASVSADVAAINAKTTNLPAAPASTTNITAGTITTVTNLTNLPAIPANWLTAAGMDATASAEIADAVWDEAVAGHLGAGSTGAALNAAGSAGDPWTTPLPGAYGAGTAGYIMGTNLDAQSSTLATASNLAVVAGYLDTEIAAIKAKTDNLPAAPAAVSDIPTAVQNADALLGRNVSGGSSAGRTVKQAFHFIRNKWVVAAGTLTVYDTDDSTSSWTSAVTGTPGADPVTGNDPA